MKERPILFCGEMVKAILNGRKTQTRRIVTPQPEKVPNGWYADAYNKTLDWTFWGPCGTDKQGCCHLPLFRNHYGQPGDRLWVKENCWIAPPNFGDPDLNNCKDYENHGRYVGYSATMDGDSVRCAKDYGVKQSPSIFMPRWASRITLEIESVRVERLQEIETNDCYQEGISRPSGPRLGSEVTERDNARGKYRDLWDLINRKTYPWASNPWVWVLTFHRVKP